MAVSMDFLQTCSKCCWRTGLLLNTKYQTHNLVSAPQGTQTNPSLFCDTFSLLRKRNKWRCSLLFWISLLPTTVFQERNFGDTCKKLRLHNIWEMSSKPGTQDAYTFSLIATRFLRRLRTTETWNRAAFWVPICTPFKIMTWTDSWLCREVLPLPWVKFKSFTVIMLMTLLSLQTRPRVCNSNWTNSMTLHGSEGSSWTLTKQKSWSSLARLLIRFPAYAGTPLEFVTQSKYLGITLTCDGSMHTAAEKMADNFRSTTAGGDQHLVLVAS